MRKRLLSILGIVAVAAITVFPVLMGGGSSTTSTGSDALVGGPSGGQLRTVLIYRTSKPEPSTPGPVMRAKLVHGRLPNSDTTATVLTDEDCAPDAAGLSRCLNKLRLSNGRVLTLRHPHRMASVPCMTPGERVRTRAA